MEMQNKSPNRLLNDGIIAFDKKGVNTNWSLLIYLEKKMHYWYGNGLEFDFANKIYQRRARR